MDPLADYRNACRIAARYGPLIKREGAGFLVFRKAPRLVLIGRRATPRALYLFVCKAAGSTDARPRAV